MASASRAVESMEKDLESAKAAAAHSASKLGQIEAALAAEKVKKQAEADKASDLSQAIQV